MFSSYSSQTSEGKIKTSQNADADAEVNADADAEMPMPRFPKGPIKIMKMSE